MKAGMPNKVTMPPVNMPRNPQHKIPTNAPVKRWPVVGASPPRFWMVRAVITPEKAVLYDLERAFMVDRWGTLLDDDPAYNPNLCITPERPAFTLPEKPRPLQAIVRTGSFVTVNHQKTD